MMLSYLLAEYRKQREISLRKLSSNIGVDRNALYRFEKGEQIESRHLAQIIRWALSQVNGKDA